MENMDSSCLISTVQSAAAAGFYDVEDISVAHFGAK